MIRTALFWKVGVPLLLIVGGLLTLIFLPALMIGGAKPPAADGGDPTDVELAGVGISDAVPEEYRSVVLRAGSICDEITPSVIAAQIEAESNWNPNVSSHAGAAGISQFMPATWAAKGLDGDGDGVADITNPEDAIWSQGNYMCELREGVLALSNERTISGSSLDLTLAAYNAGMGNVKKYSGIPPFTETRNYVTKINDLVYQLGTSAWRHWACWRSRHWDNVDCSTLERGTLVCPTGAKDPVGSIAVSSCKTRYETPPE